mmetsp:Transcript_58947/g.127959  ORF Transcript_58947/g.127959 Transcript_58947/m.127959 type:complete len:440 (+) Transcript_58947:87-1406(+)
MGALNARPLGDQQSACVRPFGDLRLAKQMRWPFGKSFESAPWRVCVRSSAARAPGDFEVEVRRADGAYAFGVRRTLAEFRQAHEELKDFMRAAGRWTDSLPDIGEASESAPASAEELQLWLDKALGSELLPGCPSLQNLLGLPNRLNLWAAPGTPSLTMLVECHQPLLLEIASYVSGSATDLVQFAHLTSRLFSRQLSFARETLWESAFAARWPSSFHECLSFGSAGRWEESYRTTLGGKREYIMEVFDREKKKGFAMAAMAARITYDKAKDSFVARYISASEVKPEAIPAREGRRLRFCPPSARPQLQPRVVVEEDPEAQLKCGRKPCYPYRVLEGLTDLVVGQGVELQWKMQKGSPFGWWFGHLEQLLPDADGKQATATITFRHFPSSSRWHRLAVRFGDNELRECSFGGYTGGIRAASPGESERWMSFFPRDPVVF